MSETRTDAATVIVRADLNARTADDFVRVRVARSSAPLSVGFAVQVRDADAEVTVDAVVERFEGDGKLAVLAVDWDSARPLREPTFGQISITSVGFTHQGRATLSGTRVAGGGVRVSSTG